MNGTGNQDIILSLYQKAIMMNISDWTNYTDLWEDIDIPDLALPLSSQLVLIAVYGLTTFLAVLGNGCVLLVLTCGKLTPSVKLG